MERPLCHTRRQTPTYLPGMQRLPQQYTGTARPVKTTATSASSSPRRTHCRAVTVQPNNRHPSGNRCARLPAARERVQTGNKGETNAMRPLRGKTIEGDHPHAGYGPRTRAVAIDGETNGAARRHARRLAPCRRTGKRCCHAASRKAGYEQPLPDRRCKERLCQAAVGYLCTEKRLIQARNTEKVAVTREVEKKKTYVKYYTRRCLRLQDISQSLEIWASPL